jgi:hypothetical protein
VINYQEGSQWKEDHLLKRFDSQKSLGVDIRVWNQLQTRFKIGFEAAPSDSSAVYKIIESKHAYHEDVNK